MVTAAKKKAVEWFYMVLAKLAELMTQEKKDSEKKEIENRSVHSLAVKGQLREWGLFK